MPTPMLVQYLVGICCRRWNPEAVEIVLGDMVFDPVASKERDVDVTVKVEEAPGILRAFKAFEVKREKAALDVADVEQLCLKLMDMPDITHRAIVSTSGFSASAQAKAAHHGVELYCLRPWSKPLQDQFPILGMQGLPHECIPATQDLLCWEKQRYSFQLSEDVGAFSIAAEGEIFDGEGKRHKKYADFRSFSQEIALRSTEILWPMDPAFAILRDPPAAENIDGYSGLTVGLPWSHTHTLDVSSDQAHVVANGKLCKVMVLTISGYLRWRRDQDSSSYYVLERVPTGEAFAGVVALMDKRFGHMTCLSFSAASKEFEVRFVRLAEKHLNIIRSLKL